jgi:hypothetical protein
LDCVRCAGSNERCPVCNGSGIEKFYRCPLRLLTPETAKFIKYYKLFKQGFLPVEGGLLNQGNTFLQAIEVFNNELNQNIKAEE